MERLPELPGLSEEVVGGGGGEVEGRCCGWARGSHTRESWKTPETLIRTRSSTHGCEMSVRPIVPVPKTPLNTISEEKDKNLLVTSWWSGVERLSSVEGGGCSSSWALGRDGAGESCV
ncbi:unnamed protein product [Pleuronectes platessa]|uniref:Uncharacterized protein n=1 Tax=Pleuronectes platessa TaxID=8262 RepID=A0A9N7UQI4_PLEPL|nr:unnamed protein product [Pleuronectes platessa]